MVEILSNYRQTCLFSRSKSTTKNQKLFSVLFSSGDIIIINKIFLYVVNLKHQVGVMWRVNTPDGPL